MTAEGSAAVSDTEPAGGLSEEEAAARRTRGDGNTWRGPSGRTYFAIARANLFSFFNNILFAIGAALVALGEVNDALTSVGLGLVNAAIGTVQEIRAKRQLDRIAVLNRPTVSIVRDGLETDRDPAEIVRGDHIRLRPGDEVAVDGTLLSGGGVEVDESLLTGESEPERKVAGDRLLSGSVAIAGEGIYRADVVGEASYANRLVAKARAFEPLRTPLQRQVDFSVRVVMLVVALMSGIILVAALLQNAPAIRIVQLAAVLSGQVPYGLFFVIVVAYSLSAAAMARRGALVQQVNAVESLSATDVLCMDKTGTLTTNELTLHAVEPLAGAGTSDLGRRLATFVRSAGATNPTATAIATAIPGDRMAPDATIPFSSARKWSAVAFAAGPLAGVHALGAFEMLAPFLDPSADRGAIASRVRDFTASGLRVLLFAGNDRVAAFDGPPDNPRLPVLAPYALVVLADVLRPGVAETLAAFAGLGIRMKIVSGDDPTTVAALARQAGVAVAHAASGPELAVLGPVAFAAAVDEAEVFGRVAPAQKEAIVAALIARGHRVAMIGDGVNDVLAIKKAQLGVAMKSGSAAARNVADIILVDNDFQPLRPAIDEGRRVIASMTTSLLLFLARVASSILVIIGITMLGLAFPFEPAQIALTLFTVGIPTFFLTLWARPAPQAEPLIPMLVRFVVPVAITTMAFGVALYTFHYSRVIADVAGYEFPEFAIRNFERVTGLSAADGDAFARAAATIVAQSALSMFVTFTAFLLILFIAPPVRLLTGWARDVSPDRRPFLLAAVLAAFFVVILVVPEMAEYFGLIRVGPGIYLSVAAILPAWAAILLLNWRRGWFDRFLGLGAGPG